MFPSIVRVNERQFQFICNELYLFVVKRGTPSSDDLEKLASLIGSDWRRLARRLGARESVLNEIHNANQELHEKAYQMLSYWKVREGGSATYHVLYDALCHVHINRRDLAEEICCD